MLGKKLKNSVHNEEKYIYISTDLAQAIRNNSYVSPSLFNMSIKINLRTDHSNKIRYYVEILVS